MKRAHGEKVRSHAHVRRYAACAALCALSVMTWSCNDNTAEFLRGGGPPVVEPFEVSVGQQVPMDILWVVDNSFSMCQEQKVLRDNFSLFVDVLSQASLDFHIALTTTHAPESNRSIEPVAQESLLQSTPQPVPGNSIECIRDESGFGPLRESLAVATRCLADPSTAKIYASWSDDQIACAIESPMQQATSGCVATSGLPDRNDDTRYNVFDLFPDYDQYRSIPKVLRAQDYRRSDGTLDEAKLELDFSCMATVGTRGDGYEKGLRAAVDAVARVNTGGAADLEVVDPSAPNHGFIRREAGFALIFVTDENDCSHDGSILETGNVCADDVCEYQNSTMISDEESKLIAPARFADKLRQNLADTKQLAGPEELDESNILIASINGRSVRNTQPVISCEGGSPPPVDRPEVMPTCVSPTLGSSFSGDRYERFMRQFQNFYPNTITQGAEDPEAARLDFSRYEPTGAMCGETFGPALSAIAEFIVRPSGACITNPPPRCESSADCRARPYTDTPGTCSPFPGREDYSYCDSSSVLILERDPDLEAKTEISKLAYCVPGSVGKIDTEQPSCVLHPSFYRFEPCASGIGLEVSWTEPSSVVSNNLSGYTVKAVFERATF